MPYSRPWLETVPAGSIDANKLDDAQRDTKTDLRERIADVFGGLSLAEFQADPVKAKGIRGGGDADFDVKGGTATTTFKDATGANNDLQIDHSNGDATHRGDVNAAGGFRQNLSGWSVTDIAASVAATEVPKAGGNRILMLRAGSILVIGVALASGQVRTAGTLTVEVWKSVITPATGARTDTATGLIAVIDGTNTAFKVTTQAKDLDSFSPGDELFLKYATDAGWLPVTADMTASIVIEA
jgi:hypothetical protein